MVAVTGAVTSEVNSVPIAELRPADSPRLAGEDSGHVETLAQSGTAFDPILVHRATRRVVDGMHRLRAAAMRGERQIRVRYLDGPEEEIFIRSVEANVAHGLPLTLGDRRAAATRILATHPGWSDRAIARTTGLSPKTVGAIRRRSSEENPQSSARVGQDGRIRPVDPVEGRRAAVALLTERPEATLREISQAVGISSSTAHEVRRLLRQGEDPLRLAGRVPRQDRRALPARTAQRSRTPEPADRSGILERLAKDPSLRFTESGRLLLRWLGTHDFDARTGQELIAAVPPHCAAAVADLASSFAREWSRFAEELAQRADVPDDGRPKAS
ncbi:ParB N-terminal domain-containing protein [Kitasatospora sp. NPDC058263]